MSKLLVSLIAALFGGVVVFKIVIQPNIDWHVVKDMVTPKIRSYRVGDCMVYTERDTGRMVNKACHEPVMRTTSPSSSEPIRQTMPATVRVPIKQPEPVRQTVPTTVYVPIERPIRTREPSTLFPGREKCLTARGEGVHTVNPKTGRPSCWVPD